MWEQHVGDIMGRGLSRYDYESTWMIFKDSSLFALIAYSLNENYRYPQFIVDILIVLWISATRIMDIRNITLWTSAIQIVDINSSYVLYWSNKIMQPGLGVESEVCGKLYVVRQRLY